VRERRKNRRRKEGGRLYWEPQGAGEGQPNLVKILSLSQQQVDYLLKYKSSAPYLRLGGKPACCTIKRRTSCACSAPPRPRPSYNKTEERKQGGAVPPTKKGGGVLDLEHQGNYKKGKTPSRIEEGSLRCSERGGKKNLTLPVKR